MKLVELRDRAGLTQTALANELGVTQPVIGKLECGVTDINNITLASGYKLSRALGCSMEDLVDKEKVQ